MARAVLPTPTRALAGADRLTAAATLFAASVLVHNFDHLRRGGDSVRADVFWVGTLAIVLEVGIVALVYARHPRAPLAATVVGLALAAGYVFVHFTPERTWLSDSLVADGVKYASALAAGFELVSAVILALVGWQALQGGPRPADGPDWTDARHPVVVLLLLGNLVVLAGSVLTR